MRNKKYLTKLLCAVLSSAMLTVSVPMAVMASWEKEPTESMTADGQEEVAAAAVENDAPGEDSNFDSGGGEEPNLPDLPLEDDSEMRPEIVRLIEALNQLGEITADSEGRILELREMYDGLTEEEKRFVTNVQILFDAEAVLEQLKREEPLESEKWEQAEDIVLPGSNTEENGFIAEEVTEEFETENSLPDEMQMGTAVQEAEPVYLSGDVLNLHAGKEFYLESLKKEYQLEFSEDFPQIMEEIEKEYKETWKLTDDSDLRKSTVTSSKDRFLVRNWQDILAVYVYQRQKAGEREYLLNREAKDALAEIFAEMNPIVRDKKDITKVSYGNRHINDYIKQEKIPKEDRSILKKYVETDCELLCAAVTAARGLVRQSAGERIAEERVNVIASAYSLVGRIGYFWGGKSETLGWDSRWGSAEMVDIAGSKTTGQYRAYGLDCSGFVTWAFNNGYWDTAVGNQIGDGTTEQWNNALQIKEEEAQPGDLVFQRGPEAGSDNHVGIICGQTDSGDWITVHCSSGKNGVTVGEAYSASFRYIRRPACYPEVETADEEEDMTENLLKQTQTEVRLKKAAVQ